ncbi:pilus assembly protein TadG-related protein [Alkalihalobacillus sp. AL-G]|uniref:pilus assembly protein TadG-related protein n=1 Tax=Alkalihalobacillus sp. AL-G TaxID=2926399 RepID=UPI00272C5ED2|nr:pilus assembly protein TadG-related protein [Alkalihalobacillus sp. AL-G]WLD93940.1 Tad domain-containing protein [Alkalihalobacillus sp. AL-G]
MIKRLTMIREESGSSIVLIGLAMLAILAILGLVIDGGSLYMTKSHLQKVANAAVLSGAQELTTNEDEVRKVAEKVLIEHTELDSLENMQINMKDKVAVDLEKQVPLYFSSLFGKESAPVQVHAAAEIGTMSSATGVAPLGIDRSVNPQLYQEYTLKVGPHDNDTGVFGILALGGGGSQTYEENLRHGYQEGIGVGDILETQTGNVAGKTRRVINELVNECTVTEEEMRAGANPRDCARILLIPIYEPYEYYENQMKKIEVVGFAYFYITEPIHGNSTEITGMFINRPDTGYIDPTVENFGAYGIRLTE